MTVELEPAQIDRERADLAWKLRVGGLSWAQVARQAGYSCRQNAMRAVKVRCGTLPQPERQELRDLWRDRLETAVVAVGEGHRRTAARARSRLRSG